MDGVVVKGEGRLTLETVGTVSGIACHSEVSDLEIFVCGSGQGLLKLLVKDGTLTVVPRSACHVVLA